MHTKGFRTVEWMRSSADAYDEEGRFEEAPHREMCFGLFVREVAVPNLELGRIILAITEGERVGGGTHHVQITVPIKVACPRVKGVPVSDENLGFSLKEPTKKIRAGL